MKRILPEVSDCEDIGALPTSGARTAVDCSESSGEEDRVTKFQACGNQLRMAMKHAYGRTCDITDKQLKESLCLAFPAVGQVDAKRRSACIISGLFGIKVRVANYNYIAKSVAQAW
jgi:hypothetical protein